MLHCAAGQLCWTHSEVCSLWGEMLDGAVAVALLEVQRVALQVQLDEDVAVLYAGLTHPHKTNMMECVCACVWLPC